MKEGWTYKKLGEVCEKSKNIRWEEIDEGNFFSYIDLSSVDRESLSIKNPQTITKANAPSRAKQIVNEGDVLFATTRPTLRRVCLIPTSFDGQICSTGFCVLRPKDNVVPQWIYYLLQNDKFYHYIEPLQTGASYPAVTDIIVKEYPIQFPSLSEQLSIVSRLDTTFANIDALKTNAEKQLTEARKLFQAELAECMRPKEGWEKKTLGEVCDIYGRIGFRGYTTKDLVSSSKDGAISLSPSNIQDGAMDYSKLTYISWFKYEESPEIKIYNGDVLLVKTGSSYGKSALVENLPHEATINPQSVVLKNFKIDNRFFAYQLRTNVVREEFDKFVSGTAIPTFSQAKLSTVPVYYPIEKVQHQIITRLDALSAHVKHLEEVQRKTLAECDALKQAMLREVFE